jgi:hypothetical protein
MPFGSGCLFALVIEWGHDPDYDQALLRILAKFDQLVADADGILAEPACRDDAAGRVKSKCGSPGRSKDSDESRQRKRQVHKTDYQIDDSGIRHPGRVHLTALWAVSHKWRDRGFACTAVDAFLHPTLKPMPNSISEAT